MSSQSMAVDVLVKACQDGDAYSGLQTFKAALQRKVRLRDEAAAHAMLLEAFQQAAVPFRSAETASELVSKLFPILKDFGHNGDLWGIEKVRAIISCFMNVPEGEVSVAWCQSHVQFVVSALGWWRAGKNSQGCVDGETSINFSVFLNEALCHANMRLAHCTENDEEALCEALASAYKASLCCALNMELILSVVMELRCKLTETERVFLVARTIHGLLSATGEDVGVSPRRALDTARSMLSHEAVPAEHAALGSFLHDVLFIFDSVLKTPTRPSVEQLGGRVIEALCRAYATALEPVADLDWVALLHALCTESE
ncbi:hypothetical protein C3747_114g44 [Trypanosoma cruzi]|uniref:Uncharacterized protein n=1 Tax=Trypanosoma cruzi TaxID=5693 RepID=A0A2V2WCY5_TRYCR|nr:hypothetical protein C3747_114g44 [Trypanosoma cruzi]